MIEKVMIAVILSLLAVVAFRAATVDAPAHSYKSTVTQEVPNHQDDDDGLGLGMTYGGRIGLELAPGIVMQPNGQIGFGIGF